MKFLHLADLHLGKSINGINLIESGDQTEWANQLMQQIEKLSPDAVVIAGDVYDRSAPSEKAVELLDHILTDIAARSIPVLMVAGNHDSGQRLSFGGSLLAKQNVYIAGVLTPKLNHVTIKGVTFWLMPYLFPMAVSELLRDDTISSYDAAARRLLAAQNIDFTQRNVLVAHQNVVADGTEAVRGGSESMVGGVGEIDYTAFDGFDYVALGHIHCSGSVGRDAVRYAGTPMCYHFNETHQPKKGMLLIDMPDDGGEPGITSYSFEAKHPMRELRGTWEELVHDAETTPNRNEYLRLIVTDRKLDPASMDHLRGMYEKRGSIIMERSSEYQAFTDTGELCRKSAEELPLEDLFADFYRSRNAKSEPSPEDAELFRFIGELVNNTPNSELEENPEKPDERELEKLRHFLNRQEVQK